MLVYNRKEVEYQAQCKQRANKKNISEPNECYHI